MNIQAEPITNSIIDKLSELSNRITKPNDLEIRKLKNDIDKLKNITPSAYFMAQGMFACLMENAQDCIKYHSLSLQLDNDAIFYVNYSLSLKKLGRYSEAHKIIQNGLFIHPTVPDLLRTGIGIACLSGHPQECLILADELNKLNLPLEETLLHYIAEANLMISADLSDKTVSQCHEIMEIILANFNAKIINNLLFKNDNQIFQWIEITANIATTIEMNFELAQTITENPALQTDNYCIAFRSAQ